MPLFMDYHKGLSVSIEDVKNAHIADEAVQSKYGVVYHQFWVNEQGGTVFCLMEGPDKESCAAVHREAHGGVACSIIEVAPGFYELLMGKDHVLDHGHVRKADGSLDRGTRTIMAVSVQGVTTIQKSAEYRSLRMPNEAKKAALEEITSHRGREVQRLPDDSLVAVFDVPADAVECALSMQKTFRRKMSTAENAEWNIIYRLGISAGQPLTETGELFTEAITLARRLSSIAAPNEIIISPKVAQYCDVKAMTDDPAVKLLSMREQEFITDLYSISEKNLADESFTVDTLSKDIGISRPQLYRKIVSLTGKSPNDFIRDLRMVKALSLVRSRAGNISEIALEVGYNNPSYFARCFQMRYGCTPSQFTE